MHGLLRRLFAPRWQHPDPEVRRKALHQLDPQQTEQREALHTLANDSDSTIQLAALLALDDRLRRHLEELRRDGVAALLE